jgi:hypothetical protein
MSFSDPIQFSPLSQESAARKGDAAEIATSCARGPTEGPAVGLLTENGVAEEGHATRFLCGAQAARRESLFSLM